MMVTLRSLVEWRISMAIRTVVFLSRLKPGGEQQLTHDLPIEFPSQTLSKIEAIKRVTICQGNGLFAAVVEYEGDFEKVFDQYTSSPSIQAFHFKIRSLFKEPPRSADRADLPLAGDVFVWDGKQFKAAAG
jgi:hypothetical protein